MIRRVWLPAVLTLVLAVTVWFGSIAGPGNSGSAWAQDVTEALTSEEYATWNKVATRADDALAAARASDRAFEALRIELVDWRSRFLLEQQRDANRIKTLEAQIETLGVPPEDGESESEELAARRLQLNQKHMILITPVVQAEEAYTQANGQILQIDRLIRERQQAKLLKRGPTPLNPQNLRGALDDLHMVVRILLAEVSSSYGLISHRKLLEDNLPAIVILVVMAGMLLLRGRRWFQQLVHWLVRRRGDGDRGVYLVAMIISVGQFVMPMLGLLLLVAALSASAMFGSVGEDLLFSIPAVGGAFFIARWLGGQSFPRLDSWPTILHLTPRERVRGRFYFSSLGILIATAILAKRVIELFNLEPETISIVAFPIIVLSALCLAGIGRLLISNDKSSERDPTGSDTADLAERGFIDGMVHLLGRLCLIFASIGPVLAMLGYFRAAMILTLSPCLSLILLALVTFLQRLTNELFRVFSPSGKDGADSLWPVLVNFALMVAFMPLFALVWGARWAGLTELWTTLHEGFSVGDTKISPTIFMVFVVVFLFGYMLTGLLKNVMRNSILPRTRLDTGAQKAMISGIGYVGIFLAAVIAVSTAGLDLSNLAIVAGALSVGVGFGLQNIVSNFVAGLILLIERPVTEGDWIEVGGVMGTVNKISVRATTVETFDRTNVVVPNSDFVTGQVTNWTRGNLSGRLILSVGVAYGTDTHRVAEVLQEVAEAHPMVIVNPPPLIVFQGFGADSLDFEMRVILRDINFGLGTRTALNHRIAERFAEEGFEIPFAQRDIWLRNPETLGRNTTPDAAPTAPPGPVIVTNADIKPDSMPEFPTEDDR